jgi:hypothetical protein
VSRLGRETPPPSNTYSLTNIGVDRYGGREKDRLDPEFVDRLNEHADVVAKLPSKLPRLGGIKSGGKKSLRNFPPKQE